MRRREKQNGERNRKRGRGGQSRERKNDREARGGEIERSLCEEEKERRETPYGGERESEGEKKGRDKGYTLRDGSSEGRRKERR